MELKLNTFFKIVFKGLLLLVFVFGGTIQYFIGVPNTLLTLIILGVFIFLVFSHILVFKIFFFNQIFVWCFIYFLIIIISGVLNNSSIVKTLLYCIFPVIPFSIFYVFKVFEKQDIQIQQFLVRFFRIVVVIQLPIILVQKFGYDTLISLNNSNQGIAEYDFMFGSFFIRGDHSLGFFLIIYILHLLFNRKKIPINKKNWMLIGYITITILIMESNLTKLVLIIILGYYLLIWLYKKINLLGMFIMIFIGYLLFNIALLVPKINGQYYFFKNKYTLQESQIAVDKTYAKRPQIVVVYFNSKNLKIIGEGPYDYFNIFNGKFKQTKHFSQLIWSYNDLGILGLLTVVFLGFTLIKALNLNRESILLLSLVLIMYLFMTNVYSDLAMILSLLLIRNIRYKGQKYDNVENINIK